MTDTRTLSLLEQFERLPMPSEQPEPVDPDEIRGALGPSQTDNSSEAI